MIVLSPPSSHFILLPFLLIRFNLCLPTQPNFKEIRTLCFLNNSFTQVYFTKRTGHLLNLYIQWFFSKITKL